MDKLKLLKKVFPMAQEIELSIFLPFVDEAISSLDEREQCVLQKRFSGFTLRETGKQIANLSGQVDPGEGIVAERVRSIEAKALRKLRHPRTRKVFNGEKTAKEKIIEESSTKKIIHPSPSPELLSKSEEWKGVSIIYMEASVRVMHGLRAAGINSIGELILKTEGDLLSIRHFGRKSLLEVKEILDEMNLSLMDS